MFFKRKKKNKDKNQQRKKKKKRKERKEVDACDLGVIESKIGKPPTAKNKCKPPFTKHYFITKQPSF